VPTLDPATIAEPDIALLVDNLARSGRTLDLVALLDERHPGYSEQVSEAIVRMRSWILAALSRGVLPDEAVPYVLEELDTATDARLVASAALALRAHPRPVPGFAPFLLQALTNIRSHDEPVSFERYGDYDAPAQGCTAVQALLDTVAWLGPAAASIAPDLRAWHDSGPVSRRLRPHLHRALTAIGDKAPAAGPEDDCCLPSWLAADRAAPAPGASPEGLEDVIFQDQDGEEVTGRGMFTGRPTLVAFFYTRCDNPLKCSLTIWKLARVQAALEQRGMRDRIRIAAITYDPDFDLPDRLQIYAANRGFRTNADHRLLRATGGMDIVRAAFGLRVSFARSLVSRHRIELFLLDAEGRITDSFPRLRWDESAVADAAIAQADTRSRADGHGPVPVSGTASGLAGATLVAVVPKCPLCWNAYLSAAGLGVVAPGLSPGRMQLVAGALLVVHVASVAWRARTTRRPLGLVLSLAGVLSLASTLWVGVPAVPVGAALVALGAIVSSRAKRVAPRHERRSGHVTQGLTRRTTRRAASRAASASRR
jgi:protein SCO1